MNKKALFGLDGFDAFLIIITVFIIMALAVATYQNQQIPAYQQTNNKETQQLANLYKESIHITTYHEQLTTTAACTATKKLALYIETACKEQCTDETTLTKTYLALFTQELYAAYPTADYPFTPNYYETFIQENRILSQTTPTMTLPASLPYRLHIPLHQQLPFMLTTLNKFLQQQELKTITLPLTNCQEDSITLYLPQQKT